MFSFFSKSKKRRRLEKEGLAISKMRLRQDSTFAHSLDKSQWISLLIVAIAWFFCLLVLLLPSNTISTASYLVLGQQAPTTIYSDFSFSYLNTQATSQKKQLAAASVPLIYEISDTASKGMLNNVSSFFNSLAAAKNDGEAKVILASFKLPDYTLQPLLSIAQNKNKTEMLIEKLSSVVYSGIINNEDLANVNSKDINISIIDINNHIRPSQPANLLLTMNSASLLFANEVSNDFSPRNRQLLNKSLCDVGNLFIKSNLSFNTTLTNVEKEIVSSSRKNMIYEDVGKGDVIVQRGEKVTPQVLERFNAYETELTQKVDLQNFWENLTYNFILSFILILLTVLLFFHLHPSIFKSNQKIGAIATVIIIAILANYASGSFFNFLASGYYLPSDVIVCLLPLGLAPVLICVLIGLRAAIFATILVCLVAAVRLDSYYVIIIGIMVSCFISYFVHECKNYKEFFAKSVIAITISFVPLQLFGLLKIVMQTPELITWIIVLSFLSAIVTSILSLAILFVIESVFKISTDMSLLSLCDYNHPLLMRLQLEAPGTYHHSLIVATLAEQAAKAIGANPIKARVCSLFHDIGKLSKPEYFTENNIGTKNMHVGLKPGMSAMIIMNHVKEGINLALKHKLSGVIRAAIEQHHGTDLVYFFYKKAIEENNGNTNISEKEYRYPGPSAIDKEVALISIADSCEAASRSLDKPTPSKIETLVNEIVRKKMKEGQLDNADLTLHELAEAKKSFIKTLNSMLHTRISYPASNDDDDDESDLFKSTKHKFENK